MVRDLGLFLDHAQQHVIDQIKKSHPEWVAPDGACRPCVEYYEKAMHGELGKSNIGPKERSKRRAIGMVALVLGIAAAFYLVRSGADRAARLFLFFPFFVSMLGLFQAAEKTCALLSEAGFCNWDGGTKKIADPEIQAALKIHGRKILVKAALFAAFLTALLWLVK